ncbi:MAG: hypothetical protein JNK45_09250 [Myxococcales bacterium]|nr:hypothetical protein [Myxococcales bacterium]
MSDTAAGRFESEFAAWVRAHADRHRTQSSPDTVLEHLSTRIPPDTRAALGDGLLRGWLTTSRGYFVAPDQDPKAAQYMLTVQNEPSRQGSPCWEVFVQLALYVRLRPLVEESGLQLRVEHKLMDIAAVDGDGILAYFEVKVDGKIAEALAAGVAAYGSKKIDLDAIGRNDDALKKAKYLLEHRPRYFVVHALDYQAAFEVEYHEPGCFRLHPTDRAIRDLLEPRRPATPTADRPAVDELHALLESACPSLWATTGTGRSRVNFYLPYHGRELLLIGLYQNGDVWSDTSGLTADDGARLSAALAACEVELDASKSWSFWRRGGGRVNLADIDRLQLAEAIRGFVDQIA